jgi:hypothetical protein
MSSHDILTKKQNYRLWQGGEFGNKLRAWRTVEDWKASGFGGDVVLRTLGSYGGGPAHYHLHPDEVEAMAARWIEDGIPSENIMVNEEAPDRQVILQGEYLNDIYGAGDDACWSYFRYSTVAAHMRSALANRASESRGLRADLMLTASMTSASHDDWLLLIDKYPKHVFEVSIYDCCLGDMPGRNALVWEVRRY